MIYLLEYSEEQGCFHNNYVDVDKGVLEKPLNTNGYRPIFIITEHQEDGAFNALIEKMAGQPYDDVLAAFLSWVGRSASKILGVFEVEA